MVSRITCTQGTVVSVAQKIRRLRKTKTTKSKNKTKNKSTYRWVPLRNCVVLITKTHYIIKGISMVGQKDVLNELYTAAVITAGAMGISYLSKRVTKDPLGVPATLNGAAKLAVAIGVSSVLAKTLQEKKYLPEEPFKE